VKTFLVRFKTLCVRVLTFYFSILEYLLKILNLKRNEKRARLLTDEEIRFLVCDQCKEE